ncbi:MAG: tetratricopeptide repeat protein [Pseudomonadota bacterium]
MGADPLAGARAAFAAGRFAEALKLAEARLAATGGADGTALHLKGLALFRLGDGLGAIAALDQAARRAPANPAILGDLGRMHAAQGAFAQAADCFRRALAIDPEALAEREDLGTALCCLERFDEGAAEYEAVLKRAPRRAGTLLRLARVRIQQGRMPEAERLAAEAVRIEPRAAAKAALLLGQAALAQGRYGEAEGHYGRALQAGESAAEALMGRARARMRQEALGAALADATAARSHPGGSPEAELLAARIAAQRGDIATAAGLGKAALALRPRSFRTRWIAAHLLAPILEDESEIAPERARWRTEVEAIEADLRLDTPERINEAVAAVQEVSNFHLHYRGLDTLAEQALYGRVLTRVARARWPDLAQRPRHPGHPRSGGKRPRVGFLSAYLHQHSIWKTHSAWITQSSAGFEKFVYYAGRREEAGYTDAVRAAADHWRREADIARLAPLIAADALDVLIYLDHGMAMELQLLAALPLAPVQANGLGHPITSGLPSFTHALTSARMEPADGDRHYSERLVRFSGSAACYAWARLAKRLEGLDPPAGDHGRVRFLCAQHLSKYLPQHDRLLALIAAELPQAEFHFVGSNEGVIGRLEARLARAFAALGLDAQNHVRFHGPLMPPDYFRLNLGCDVFLDGVMWSGNNTTHEAIACGLPVVTWPGPEMRGRHAAALLAMMGLEDTVARDLDHYVELAVALGREPERRRHLRAETEARRAAIYDDPAPIADLDRFIREQVEARD